MQACIPMALQIVIDDVGWWSGKNEGKQGGPFRTGIQRNHALEDYHAVVQLGKQLNMRPQAAMVLSEWDQTNMLQHLPNSTWLGKLWDNSRWVGPWLENAANILHEGRDHVEITLHGIGHEYWENGKMSRAEWHDREGVMRPRGEVLAHLYYFEELMRQNELGPFPCSYVPAAFMHRFGDPQGLASILKEKGIQYISTPMKRMAISSLPEDEMFGIDNGILTVDRGNDPMEWNQSDPNPLEWIEGPIYGMHWPNVLHDQADQNAQVVKRWVEYFRSYEDRIDRILGRNTAEAFSQLVYHRWGQVKMEKDRMWIDCTRLRNIAIEGILDYFYIKLKTPQKVYPTSEDFTVSIVQHDESPRPFTLIRVDLKNGETIGSIEW